MVQNDNNIVERRFLRKTMKRKLFVRCVVGRGVEERHSRRVGHELAVRARALSITACAKVSPARRYLLDFSRLAKKFPNRGRMNCSARVNSSIHVPRRYICSSTCSYIRMHVDVYARIRTGKKCDEIVMLPCYEATT